VLDSDRFHTGTVAETTKQKIVYDADLGWLLYFKHGSNTPEPLAFAEIGKHLVNFDNTDILVI
jgi:hypothetical protein